MMKKVTKRIFLGLLIITLGLLLVVPISSFAEEETTVSSECQGETIDKKYTFTAKTLSDEEGNVTGFEIEAYKNNDVKKSDLDFELYKIGDIELSSSNYIKFTPGTKSNPYVLTLDNYPNAKDYFKKYSEDDLPDDGNLYYTHIHLRSIKGKNASVSQCNVGDTVSIKTSVAELGAVRHTIAYTRETPIDTPSKSGHEIDKTKEPSDAFDKLIYDAFKYSSSSQSFVKKGSSDLKYVKEETTSWHVSDSDVIKLQCDYTQKFKYEDLKYSSYYKNTKWMYASNTYSIQGGDYIFHPISNKDEDVVKVPGGTCTVTCEEGVKVEYGPPVASKAGLCFEYKVRITSHVNCYSVTEPPAYPASDSFELCEPTPVCNHPSGWVLSRAGPNEEFAQCVQDCDGGKYSLNCSKKCYKKVYGTSNNNISNNLYTDYVDSIVDHTKDCTDQFGCYYLSGGKIKWAGKSTSGKSTLSVMFTDDSLFGDKYLGRYYINRRSKEKGGTGELKYLVFERPFKGFDNKPIYRDYGDGFARMRFGRVSYCTVPCYWKGCTNPYKKDKNGNIVGIRYYLNSGLNGETMKADDEANVATYNQLVALCDAAAKCSTQHAEFEMSVDYKTGETTKTISFPYDESKPNATSASKPDQLCSNGGKESSGCTSTYTNRNTTIIYDANAKKAENDIPKNDQEMHYYENPIGCYDSANISSSSTDDTKRRSYRATISFPGTWINYKTGEITFKPVSDETHWEHVEYKFCIPREAKDVNTKYWLYYQGGKICEKTVTSVNASDIEEWNIKAVIRDFGLYNWNVNVECFYALDEEDNLCHPGETKYRIRSVDLNDLFPDTEGSSRNATSDTGREPGFNWSSNAIISDSKNAYYRSNPSTLINQIQGVNYGVYSKKYLDYEFNLDKNTLREMRKEINDKNYTDFNEDGFKKSEKAGIGYYFSERIRNLGNKNKTPDEKIVDLVCNNLQLDDNGNYLDTCGTTNGESE